MTDQLLASTVRNNGITGAILERFVYGYDKAGTRTSERIDSGVTKANHNNLNQLTDTVAGGPVRVCRAFERAVDPLEEGGMNLYAYVGNNPINGIDPLGLASISEVIANFDLYGTLQEEATSGYRSGGLLGTLQGWAANAGNHKTHHGRIGFDKTANSC